MKNDYSNNNSIIAAVSKSRIYMNIPAPESKAFSIEDQSHSMQNKVSEFIKLMFYSYDKASRVDTLMALRAGIRLAR